ncbi:MAG: hypothetical protein WCH03_04195 [Flavobacteriia bacterium]|jgi:hypothetical protein
MKQVSLASIEKAIEIVDNLTDEQLENVSGKYALAQQELLDYVMTAPAEYENEDLEGLLIYYFCVISECFTQEGINLRQVTEADIDEIEEPYFDMLEQYFDEEDEEIIESFCDQPFLAQFMAMEVSTEDEDGSSLDEETATQLFIVTLAMVSLMNRAIEA